MRSRSHERSRRSQSSQHHAPSRSHSSRKNPGYSRRSSDGNSKANRNGLRIFVGTANLGHCLPDEDSLVAFLPRHGKAHNVINFSVKSSSIVDGVSRASWSNINTHGKLEVIAIGLQEATSSGNILTTSGITSKLTGTDIKERNNFKRVLGSIGKPMDDLHCMASDFMANAVHGGQAELGGTKKLKDMIVQHIGDDYTLLTEFQRGELVLYLFVRNDLAPSSKVTLLKGANVGVGGIMANKCGIAALLSVGDTRLSFVCAHLSAHEGNYQSRNSNVADILAGTNDPTLTSHHSFVFGDLNYRTELPRSSKGDTLTKEEAKIISQKMIAQRDWVKFNELDELRKALVKKDILVGFHTPDCRFPPTFKVEKKEGFHYNFQRTPSYTDRILWKSNEETRSIEPIIYEAPSNFTTSDHKPVRGLFFLPSRPSLKLDSEKTLLNVELSQIQCKGLKPEGGLLDSDLNTFMRVRCEPSHLLKISTSSRLQTDTIRITDRPSWRNDALRFQVNVLSKGDVHGSNIYLESVQENMMAGSTVLGTVVFDLEHTIRKTLGVKERSESLSCDLLRHSKCVGKVTCNLQVSWHHPPISRCSTSASEINHQAKSELQSGSEDGSSVTEKVSNSPLRQRVSEVTPAARSKSKSQGEVKDENTSCRVSTYSSKRRSGSTSSHDCNISEKVLSGYLSKLKLPQALLFAVKENYYLSDRRMWVIDSSCAMQIRDSRLMGDDNKVVQVSRWEELCECVCFHSKMGARVGMETDFQLLYTSDSQINQRFCVGSRKKTSSDEIEVARKTMEAITPKAPHTPLVEYIQNFVKNFSSDEAHELKQKGKFISLILATQGVPSSKDAKSDSDAFRALGQALKSLNKLPVKLVIRLCTGDEETVRCYNEVLTHSLQNCDVLNDYEGEAMEVYLYNPWLTYSLGLHRLREAGLAWGMDMLDEKTLSFDKIHRFCNSYFYGKSRTLPHPHDDWNMFIDALSKLNNEEMLQYHPVKKKMCPWIDLRKLESMYRHRKKQRACRDNTKETKSSEAVLRDSDASLDAYLQKWAYQPPAYQVLKPLTDMLTTVPDALPPINPKVESHEYFLKWKEFSEEAFDEESGDELTAVLRKAMKKVKLFFHPDKLPADLTESQSKLFKAMWDFFMESEAIWIK